MVALISTCADPPSAHEAYLVSTYRPTKSAITFTFVARASASGHGIGFAKSINAREEWEILAAGMRAHAAGLTPGGVRVAHTETSSQTGTALPVSCSWWPKYFHRIQERRHPDEATIVGTHAPRSSDLQDAMVKRQYICAREQDALPPMHERTLAARPMTKR